MKTKTILIIASAATIFILMTTKAKAFAKPTAKGIIRGCDASGCGAFGSGRGARLHEGEDYTVSPGESIFSPISGNVIRYPFPYGGDLSYTGILIENARHSVKIFYMAPSAPIGSAVSAGQLIGTAQNISAKYSSPMTNHIHVELRDKASNKLLKLSDFL